MSRTIHIQIDGHTHRVTLAPDGSAQIDDTSHQVDARLLAPGVLSLLLTTPDGLTHSFHCILDPGDEPAVLIAGHRIPFTLADPRSLRAATSSGSSDAGPRPLKAPMPGRVVRILVAPGDTVEAGQGCIVIEAMKMQNELKSPKAGSIARLSASLGDTVASGAVLLVVD